MQLQRGGRKKRERRKGSEPAGAMNARGREESNWQQQRRKRKDGPNARAMETGKREDARGRETTSADFVARRKNQRQREDRRCRRHTVKQTHLHPALSSSAHAEAGIFSFAACSGSDPCAAFPLALFSIPCGGASLQCAFGLGAEARGAKEAMRLRQKCRGGRRRTCSGRRKRGCRSRQNSLSGIEAQQRGSVQMYSKVQHLEGACIAWRRHRGNCSSGEAC